MTNVPAGFGLPRLPGGPLSAGNPPPYGLPRFVHPGVIERRRLLTSGTATTAAFAAVTAFFGLAGGFVVLLAESRSIEDQIIKPVLLGLAAFCITTVVNPIVFYLWGRRAPNAPELRRRLGVCMRVYLVAPLCLGAVWAIEILWASVSGTSL
jgi:hypothetical protein